MTTLAEVKEFLQITEADWDTILSKLISRVSAAFDSYCRRPLKARDIDVVLDGNGLPWIWLPTYPINSISNLWVSKKAEWTSDNLVAATDYIVQEQIGRLSLKPDSDIFLFPDVRNSVRIQFNGGYSTVPADLEQACIEEVARRFLFISDKILGRITETGAAGSVSYETGPFLRTVQSVLTLYRDWRQSPKTLHWPKDSISFGT